MEFERHRYEQHENKKSSLLPIISASLLVHVALGVWLLRSPLNVNPPSTVTTPTPIKAKLVFIEPTPLPPSVTPELQEIEIPEQTPEQELAEASPTEEVEVNEPDAQEPLEVTQQELSEPAEQDRRDHLPALDLPEQKQTATDSSQYGMGASRDLARQHLQSFQSQAIERLSEQQAKQHQKAKASPDLQIPEFDPFTTEDEKFQQEVSVRVDCSSSVNKTLSVLSGITGGGLKCSEGQDLTPYLKKHLTKGLDAPKQQNR